MAITMYQICVKIHSLSTFHTVVIQSFIHPVVMEWLHCVWSVHKTWCYKVVLFDYQGTAPRDFSLHDHVTTIFTYLVEKKSHANEYSTVYHGIKFRTISTTTSSLHDTATSLTLRRLHRLDKTIIEKWQKQCSMK